MRLFIVLGVAFLAIGVVLVFVALLPHASGVTGEMTGMGAGIVALTLVPMGIVFTIIGVAYARVTAARRRLLASGIPAQATILSVSGGSMVVNNVNVLLTYRLRVMVPGRAPYETDHRQLTPMFQMASLQVGASVPVLVDPTEPQRLTIDLANEAGSLREAQSARPGSGSAGLEARPWSAVQPNILSSMGGVTPNTIAPSDATAIHEQLRQLGISVDPGLLTGGQVTLDGAALDLRPGVQEAVLATGRPGTAIVRTMSDTGVNVRGDALFRLTLDVMPEDGSGYTVSTGSLVPEAARARVFPGARVQVRIDPDEPTSLAIDWSDPA